MGLRYVVITSVTRDDLPDGGAGCFAETIGAVRKRLPAARIEVLIPDFQGDPKALLTVINARPDVLNHNIETVPRLYPQVRSAAQYRRSLELLKNVADFDPAIATKSGLMLGLGEISAEINQTLKDLRAAGCRILTLGQYLQPTPEHLPVYRYVTPEEFDRWGQIAQDMGFDKVSSGPLVRSSYHAKELYAGIRPDNETEL
jgi:lipoic acid synthetase